MLHCHVYDIYTYNFMWTSYSCDCVYVYKSTVHLLISDLVLISLNVIMWDCTELKTNNSINLHSVFSIWVHL